MARSSGATSGATCPTPTSSRTCPSAACRARCCADWILDEATAEAGSAGARELELSARAALAGRTAVVVAHRLTQAQECDEVAVMADGRIVEQGRPADLVAAGGAYARLWAAWHAS